MGNGRRLATADNPLLQPWRHVVTASDAYRGLTSIRIASAHPRAVAVAIYLLLQAELWARSYTQWIAERSGDSILTAQLIAARWQQIGPIHLPRHWEDDDCGPVANAIDDVFWRLKWLI
jgi:hypothetical protein